MVDSDDPIEFLRRRIAQHQRLVRLYRAALAAELSIRGDVADLDEALDPPISEIWPDRRSQAAPFAHRDPADFDAPATGGVVPGGTVSGGAVSGGAVSGNAMSGRVAPRGHRSHEAARDAADFARQDARRARAHALGQALRQRPGHQAPANLSASAEHARFDDPRFDPRATVRQRIVALLAEVGHPMRAEEIAHALDLKRTSVSSELVRGEEAGELYRVARGLYGLPPADVLQGHGSTRDRESPQGF